MFKKLKHNKFFQQVISNILYACLKSIFLTYRLMANTPNKQYSAIIYFWHQNIIGCIFFLWKTKNLSTIIVSPSSDGKIAGTVLEKLGVKVLYGSSYKNTTSVIRSALKILKTEKKLILVGDGSRGPAFKLQPGIKYFAEKSNLPIIFVECKTKHSIAFKKSWDKFKIPLPFSKIVISPKNQIY
jgi:lysophospholipid acyltransferase (LPLAT)-like uncharacterized protein